MTQIHTCAPGKTLQEYTWQHYSEYSKNQKAKQITKPVNRRIK
jgi:hypothetical protein